MKSYTKPDFETDVEKLRAQIKRDYIEMVKCLELPKRFDFPHARKAVLAGGTGMNDGSPYEKFKGDLLHVVASNSKEEHDLDDALQILTGVWNHFPHDDLDGLSPIEKMRDESVDSKKSSNDLPTVNMEKYTTEIDREILSLSDAVANNLLAYLKDVGLNKEDQQHMLGILSDPHQEPENAIHYFFTRIIDTAKKKKKHLTIDDMQPAVRALMWCENYTASKMPNGHVSSRMFQNIVEQTMEHNNSITTEEDIKTLPGEKAALVADPLGILLTLSMIHDAISEYSVSFHVDIGMEEATRHLVDWLALVDMHELLVRNDLNISTFYFFGAARLIAATGDPKRPYKRLATRLYKEVASDADPKEFDREVKRIAEKVLYTVQDPIMLMPYPGKEPNNCMENLAELAPDIKFRSPLNDDPSFIPPNFLQ